MNINVVIYVDKCIVNWLQTETTVGEYTVNSEADINKIKMTPSQKEKKNKMYREVIKEYKHI